MFLSLPMTASRWKQELKKRALGLPSVGCELPGLQPHSTSNQRARKISEGQRGRLLELEEPLRIIPTQVGRLGPREKQWGHGKSNGVCFRVQSG